MGGTARLALDQARQLADELVQLLEESCERIVIAGSIRRGSPDVGDVEIVCIPRMETIRAVSQDMFAEPVYVPRNLLDERCMDLLEQGVFEYRLNTNGGKSWGTSLKWGTYKGFAFDIYCADRKTWGVTLVIRTGPAEFSHRLVTPRSQNGLCPSNMEFKGWRVRYRGSRDVFLDTPEEVDVFRVLGLPYIEPQDRTG
jgi:DNA polymerase/3'-5' exonuclease PolX